MQELDDIPVERDEPKRKRGKSPTSRCLDECRKRGWIAGVVERFVKFPPPGHHVDLFGVIDIVAAVPPRRMLGPDGQPGQTVIEPGYILGIQASPGSRHGAHRTKILGEPRALDWLDSGGRLELWSWDKRGAHYERARWTLRVEEFTNESAWAFGVEAGEPAAAARGAHSSCARSGR